jgi:DNA repair exonuclease SbcCD ATPase subunit
MAIKKFTISGFRGILSPFILDFVKGHSERSMVIYGRNGTGKSSITDAWEWFHLGRIDHLAREGARESSYPHREAKQGETFAEIEFSDNQIGTVHIDFNLNRVTMPTIRGDIQTLRKRAPHPCHLRYNDLTRFVFSTKAEQYDSLARLMGFAPQVEIQKGLRRVQRRIAEEKDRAHASYQGAHLELQQHLGFDPKDTVQFLHATNARLSHNGVTSAGNSLEISLKYSELRAKVTTDPAALELGFIQNTQRILAQLTPNSQFPNSLAEYQKHLSSLRGQEASYLKQLLIQLYEKGIEVLSEEIRQGGQPDNCPLCGKRFNGNLIQHIQTELGQLRQLKDRRDALER